ncbi:NAD(P)H-dependent oxidoreductase [Paracnuella aquatica]|uniref:NAD(P)H-dependent oxidoreductase n=1 Tax=Paracnuella aquatica TaxID=2268757 RepID=UPI000DEF7628|nr:NAD(P)H-dependent oxidoreductase [Paracnuella aquatica]RPD51689.1 NAD(P)H oxidoreductase [Paracnuella aquatica]
MPRLLILFAHPLLEKSRVHSRLIKELKGLPDVTFHDLYEAYPDFDINVPFEQSLLLRHDVIVMQHPLYWYSAPPIMKQWIDLVLEHGWAYGKGGTQLTGKMLCNFLSAGSTLSSYTNEGQHAFPIRQFLLPFQQTAALCHMQYLPPFVVPGSHQLGKEMIDEYASQYRQLLQMLTEITVAAHDSTATFLNDWLTPSLHTQALNNGPE